MYNQCTKLFLSQQVISVAYLTKTMFSKEIKLKSIVSAVSRWGKFIALALPLREEQAYT